MLFETIQHYSCKAEAVALRKDLINTSCLLYSISRKKENSHVTINRSARGLSFHRKEHYSLRNRPLGLRSVKESKRGEERGSWVALKKQAEL